MYFSKKNNLDIEYDENSELNISKEDLEMMCFRGNIPHQEPLSVIFTYRPPSRNLSIALNLI